MGMNWTRDVALYRENTVKSFLNAAHKGATFVEFDVQVTKDGVPVIWHDDDIVFGTPRNPTIAKIQVRQPA